MDGQHGLLGECVGGGGEEPARWGTGSSRGRAPSPSPPALFFAGAVVRGSAARRPPSHRPPPQNLAVPLRKRPTLVSPTMTTTAPPLYPQSRPAAPSHVVPSFRSTDSQLHPRCCLGARPRPASLEPPSAECRRATPPSSLRRRISSVILIL